MTITVLTSLSQLNGILEKSKDKLTVIDFHATWCGPCHAIAPVYEELSKTYTPKGVTFLKCDVDAAKEVAQTYAVSAMPTFLFLKGSTKVDQVRGANKAALQSALERHSSGSSSGSAFSGKGQTLGSGGSRNAGPQPTASTLENAVGNLDPQLKVLLAIIGFYLLFWYLG
ncbi:thioredoxin-domain-containing protein [Pterulicium gracile]|uniref:Thioredoxin-domain-containing protein n=1 Tax=Pterulicium gracile TaxID=1884261 RepID=A0A5C3QP20_9AGAR|nr:thioredoxin-domain-containing protein [Pterula gracilis]